MIELTNEQRQQLANGKTVVIMDAETAQPLVIMRKDMYEQVRSLLYDDSELTHEEMRLQLARSAQEIGWNDPEMDAYDRYDEELQACGMSSANCLPR